MVALDDNESILQLSQNDSRKDSELADLIVAINENFNIDTGKRIAKKINFTSRKTLVQTRNPGKVRILHLRIMMIILKMSTSKML